MIHCLTHRLLLPTLIVFLLTPAGCTGDREDAPQVVVAYISEDQVFSEPILGDFERETGIRVQAVFDTEETKSTGVMNRLLAEKNNPQADVFWANEPIRAEYLKQEGIASPYFSPNAAGIPDHFKDREGYWTGFSARSRPFVVHSSLPVDKPGSLLDYVDPRFKGKGVIANPLFGTTTVYIAALFTLWGDDEAKQFLNRLKTNGVKISTSNGESADLVGSGEFHFSLRVQADFRLSSTSRAGACQFGWYKTEMSSQGVREDAHPS